MDLKMEKMSQKALERKSNKPIMEKKRRARINHCLNQLKSLILETDNERSRHSKLEKADILEMTVKYLQTLRAYHVHLQQIHQLQQQHSQLQHLQQRAHLQQPQSPSQQLKLMQQQSISPLSAPSSPQSLNLQLPLPLPLQLHAQTSPTQLNHHLLNHPAHHHHPNQISPTWRPW